MVHHNPTVSPPWSMTLRWEEANQSLERLLRLHRSKLALAGVFARDVQAQLESIFPVLDDLCASTCPWCPDPCCLSAKVWIDFKDLLFFHLRGHKIPPGQLLANVKQICRYASLKGCTLARVTRPWVCSWYLCPTQKAVLRNKPRSVQGKFYQTVQAIKSGRENMETAFIRVVSWPGESVRIGAAATASARF